jgi:hypothetical protein
LLHETGHIFYDDNGSYGEPSPIKEGDLEKLQSSQTKNTEVRADKFAVE